MDLWQYHQQYNELLSFLSGETANSATRLHYLYAPKEFGTISLINEIEDAVHKENNKYTVTIYLSPDIEMNFASVWQAARSSSLALQEKIDTLSQQINEKGPDEDKELVTTSLANWKEEMPDLCFFIFIPRYSDYETQKKEFLLLGVLTLLEDLQIKSNYLVSGYHSIFKSLDLEQYWFPFEKQFKEIEVQPFEKKKLLTEVQQKNLDEAKFDLFWEETEGVPSKVLCDFDKIPIKKPQDVEKINVHELLTSLSQEEQHWIIMAAYLGKVNRESFDIIFNPYDTSSAIRYIKSQGVVPIKMNDGKTWLDDLYAESIRAWHAKINPEQHLSLEKTAVIVNEVHATFPHQEERMLLALLSALNAFTLEIVDSILQSNAKAIKKMIRSKPEYFDQRNKLFSLKKKYRHILRDYPKVKKISQYDEVSQKAKVLWGKELTRLEALIADYKKKLKEEELEEEKNKNEVHRLLSEIKSAEKVHIKRFKADWKQKQFRTEVTTVKKSFVIPLILLLTGAGSFYLGMIYFKELSWPYLLAGGLFMSLGLWQSSDSKEKVRKIAVPLDESQLHKSIEQDEFIALLQLKKDALFHQKKFIHSRIERYKKELSGNESLLQMPYV